MNTRAPFAYYGGKAGMAPTLIALMPEHRVYMEPFFGSGAVLFAKPPARFEIVNDLNRNVVTFFEVLRTKPAELEAACLLTPHARDEFLGADCDDPSIDDVERARRFWVRVNQSFAKNDGTQTGWSITTQRSQSVAASIVSRVGRFADAAARLMLCAIENCDAVDLIGRLATAETLIYCDPPYLADTRRSRSQRNRTADYLHDMGLPAEHERLAGALHDTPAKVVLSGYPSDLYDQLYADWHHVDVHTKIHSSNAVSADRRDVTERIWLNYEPPVGDDDLVLDLWPDDA